MEFTLVGFSAILQKPAICCIMPVGLHTLLRQYPAGVWQLSSITRSSWDSNCCLYAV